MVNKGKRAHSVIKYEDGMTKNKAPLLQRMKDAGFRSVDFLILALFFGYLAFMVAQLSGEVSFEKGILLAILSYYMLRIFYEFTFNRGNIPTMATGFFEIKKIAELIKADFKAKNKTDYHVLDCGSGKGQMTRTIARAVPAAHVLGLEMATLPYRQSQFFKKLFGFKNIEYQQKDFFAHDCRNADAVVIFLNGRITELLGEKLYDELKAGALVITNEFELKGRWPAPEAITMYTPFKGNLFVYRR